MRPRKASRWGRETLLTLMAALAGGSVFGPCQTRLHDAFIGGTKNFVFSLFNPALVLEQLGLAGGNAASGGPSFFPFSSFRR